MNTLVAFSSKTGNTQKVAKHIASHFKFDIKRIEDGIDDKAYDRIIICFWIDKSTANKSAKEYLDSLENKEVAIVFTLGDYPDSQYANKVMENLKKEVELKNNKVIASFKCQGKIDPKITEMFKKMGKDSPHYMDETRMKRHEDAKSHPDKQDLDKVIEVLEQAL